VRGRRVGLGVERGGRKSGVAMVEEVEMGIGRR